MHLQTEPISRSSLQSAPQLGLGDSLSQSLMTGLVPAEKRPLRIMLVVEASAGGTGRHVLDLADGFVKRGHRVHMVHSTIRIDWLFQQRLAQIKGLPCLALPMRVSPHPTDLRTVRAIRKVCSEHGPFDVIHGHSSKGGALARFAALGTDARAFYTAHGLNSMDPGMPRWKRGVYVSIERTLSRYTAGIIAVSPEEARAATAIGLGGSPRLAQIATIPNGVDHLDLAPRDAARGAIGADANEIVIGFVGRLVEQKAPEILIKAFAAAVTAVPNARLAVVGDGPLRGRLVKMSADLGIADRITWLGERDAREVLAGFDLFALSSRKEGLPYVVLEAMYAGLPVVATSSSGVEVLVEPGVNGSVIPPDDSSAFGKALIQLLQDPSLLNQFGAASRTLIARFTVDEMVEKTLRFYRSGASFRG
jgi:glycosyltransferase involved in cell wall biosynthesis